MSVALRTLHLTNGSAITSKIRDAGIEGTILPWNDLLHEGPVPTGLGPAALREIRASFLAGCGWGLFRDILRDLEERDTAVDAAVGGANAPPIPVRVDEIVLWFEHDLFDQLQLIQILDRLPVDGAVRITATTPATYLGHLSAGEFAPLMDSRRVVSSAEQLAARDAWQAFRSGDPREVHGALARVSVLPHLAPALQRHLEQFPSLDNGLSRTEQQALEAIAAGVNELRDVYVTASHTREDAMFMGDAGFLFHISALVQSHRPLLATGNGAVFEPASGRTFDVELFLTDEGERVLANTLDRVAHCGIDRWLGGVHLEGNGPVWRWDRSRQTVRRA